MTPIGAISQTVLRNDLAVRTITVEQAVITRAEQTFNNLKGPFKAAAEASEYQSVNMKGWKYTKKATGSTAALEKELKRLGGKVDKVERTTQTFGKRLDDFFSRLNKLGDKFDDLIKNIGKYLRNVPGLKQVLDAASTPSGQRFFSWVSKVGSKLLVILQILDLLGTVANVTAWWYNVNRVNQLQTRMDALEKEIGKILSNLATFKSRIDKMEANLRGISLGELQKLRDDSRVLGLKFNDFGTKFNTLSQTVNTQKQSLLDQARRILTLEGLVKTFVTFVVFRQSIDFLSGLVGQLRQQNGGFQNSIQFLSGKVGNLQTQITGLGTRIIGAETKAAQALSKAGIPGPAGKQGVQGLPGIPGRNGVDGRPGLNGRDGKNGINGINGINGVTTTLTRSIEVPVYVEKTVIVEKVDPTLKAAVLQGNAYSQTAANQSTQANQKIGIVQNTLNVFSPILTNTLSVVGKIEQYSYKIGNHLGVSRIFQILTLWMNLNILMTTSANIFSLVGSGIDAAFNLFGFAIKGPNDEAIGISSVIKNSILDTIKNIVGKETFEEARLQIANLSRVNQASQSIYYGIVGMMDPIRYGVSEIYERVSRSRNEDIVDGNKTERALWDENADAMRNKNPLGNIVGQIQNAENATSMIASTVQTAQSIGDSFTQLKTDRDTLKQAATDLAEGKNQQFAEDNLNSEVPVTLDNFTIGKK
jgi:predicted  nucleic acid-binding Zn-ribbon protein